MKPAPPAASKPHMLYINRAIIPDPEAPEKHDAYGINAPELVIYTSAGNMVDFAFRGTACRLPWGMLPAFLASVGFRALGRLENRTGVKQRPEDFDLTGAVNDLGPRLRALREQTGLRIGEFARAVRGSMSQLSSIELGEWQEDRQLIDLAGLAEVREDDVLAMASEAVVAFHAGHNCYVTKKATARGEYEMTLTFRPFAPSTKP